MRWIPFASVLILLLSVASGCGPRISKEDLGEIEYKLPKLPEPESQPRPEAGSVEPTAPPTETP